MTYLRTSTEFSKLQDNYSCFSAVVILVTVSTKKQLQTQFRGGNVSNYWILFRMQIDIVVLIKNCIGVD